MDDDTDRNGGTGPAVASEAAASLDTVFEVLADRRRRLALYVLTGTADGVVEFETLAEEVATLSAALDGAAFTRDLYLGVATDLYHWHLPVLSDVGVVDCDARHGTVRYLAHPTLERWVRRAAGDELP